MRLCYTFVTLGGEPSSGLQEKKTNPEVFTVLFFFSFMNWRLQSGLPGCGSQAPPSHCGQQVQLKPVGSDFEAGIRD